MHAMVLEKPRPAEESPLTFRELSVPTPGAAQVRVQVRCCGLCHTDLHTVEGDLALPRLPLVPGHQIVGVVDALGRGVRRFKEGDRVGIPWLHHTDGTCDNCRRGLENLCDKARFTGLHTDGGYAQFVIVDEDFAHPIPASFANENAAPLLCAGIIGYRSYRLSGIGSGQRLGLYGFGASAHLVLQLARYQGCETYVFTRAENHRQLARRLGANWVGGVEEVPLERLDAGIIFAPAGALVPAALRNLRKGGTLALAGITMSAIPEMDYSLLYDERVVRSVANSTRQDCREFLQLAAEAQLKTEIRVYGLEQANQALQDLKHSRIEGAGVLMVS